MNTCTDVFTVAVLFASLFKIGSPTSQNSWDDWWTYDGISGPENWSRNPDWSMCSHGHQQSPIDIQPEDLLYDQFLHPIRVEDHVVTATLYNQGQSLVVHFEDSGHYGFKRKRGVNSGHNYNHNYFHVGVSGGPLSYRYRLEEAYIHYGLRDGEGSEHKIAGAFYPGEIQFYGYNSDLCANMSDAAQTTHGVVGISVMLQVKKGEPYPEMANITDALESVQYKGQRSDPFTLSIGKLLPRTTSYMTYEGSSTIPGCWETVTWIIMNKPIYITTKELEALRRISQQVTGRDVVAQGGNSRPVQPLHKRAVRTNIDFVQQPGKKCPTMQKIKKYRANTVGRHLSNRRVGSGASYPGSPPFHG